MVSSQSSSVDEYLSSLPAERRKALLAVRRVIRKHLPRGFEEGMQFGMIGYYVPLSRYPSTYNGKPLAVAALAAQKGYMSLYLMGVYGSPELRKSFEQEYRATGKKLDMGKSCVRFKSLDDLPLDVVARAIAKLSVEKYLALYEASRRGTRTTKKVSATPVSVGAPKKRTARTTKKRN